jgi:hypothetical protein
MPKAMLLKPKSREGDCGGIHNNFKHKRSKKILVDTKNKVACQ